jgi:polyferredoxin
MIENGYRLQIINKDGQPHRYTIGAQGIDGLEVVTAAREIAAAPLQTIDLPVSLIADPAALKGRSIEVSFVVQATDDPRIRDEVETKFFNR